MKLHLRYILLPLLFLPAFAFADSEITLDGNAWTFYAYGNGTTIVNILRAITRVITSDGFIDIAMGLTLVGFILSGVMGLLKGQGSKFGAYFVGLIVSVYMLFSVTVDVYVEELILNSESSPASGVYGELIEDVPAAIGLPVALVSELGMWLTDALETNFIDPKGIGTPLISDGIPFGASAGLIRDISNVRIQDPELRHNFQQYFRDCSMPKISNGELDAETIRTSVNIWNDIQVSSPSIFTSFKGAYPYDGVMSCQEATAELTAAIDGTAPSLLNQVVGGNGGLFTLADPDTINALLTYTVSDTSADATAAATQAGLMALFNDSHQYAATALGANEVMLSLNMANASRSQKGGWYATAILFQDMAGYFYAILQSFVIGLAPIIIMIIFLPAMGAKIASSYGKVLIWLMLWSPGLAISNYIMVTNYQSQMAYVWKPDGGVMGLSMSGAHLSSVYTDNMLMACAFMATLVPTIMWGIVSGAGMIFASALDRASGANYAAQGASGSMASNATIGESRINNTNMNSNMTTERHTGGYEAQTYYHGAGGQVSTSQMSGTNTDIGGHKQTQSSTDSNSVMNSQQYQETVTASQKWGTSVSSAAQTVSSAIQSYAQENGLMENGSIDYSALSQTEQGKQLVAAAQAVQARMDQVQESTGQKVEDSVIKQASMSAGAGAGTSGASAATKAESTKIWQHKETDFSEERETGSDTDSLNVTENVQATHGHKEGTTQGVSSKQGFTESERAAALETIVGAQAVADMSVNEENYQESAAALDAYVRSESVTENRVLTEGVSPQDYQDIKGSHTQFIQDGEDQLTAGRADLSSQGEDIKTETNHTIEAGQGRIHEAESRVVENMAGVTGATNDGLNDTDQRSKVGPSEEEFQQAHTQALVDRNQTATNRINNGGGRVYESQLVNIESDGVIYQPVGSYSGKAAFAETDIQDHSVGQTVYRVHNPDGDGTYQVQADPRRGNHEISVNPTDFYGIMEDGEFKQIDEHAILKGDDRPQAIASGRDYDTEDNKAF